MPTEYYNRVLTSYTQKAISKVLTQLWKADPFTAKWFVARYPSRNFLG